jgi:hypothetical protein
MQRPQLDHLHDGVVNLFIDVRAFHELLAAVQDPVSHRGNLLQIRYRLSAGVQFSRQSFEDQLNGVGVIFAVLLHLEGFLPLHVVPNEGIPDSDPLHDSGRDGRKVVFLEEGIFRRGRSAVEAKNVTHVLLLRMHLSCRMRLQTGQ